MTKTVIGILLFTIGTLVSIGSLISIIPSEALTELGKETNNTLFGKSLLLNFMIFICGFYTCFKGLQKI